MSSNYMFGKSILAISREENIVREMKISSQRFVIFFADLRGILGEYQKTKGFFSAAAYDGIQLCIFNFL